MVSLRASYVVVVLCIPLFAQTSSSSVSSLATDGTGGAVQVEAKGLKVARKTGNIVTANTPITVNIGLNAGYTAEVVTVEADAQHVQTASAAMANTVTQKAIVELR
jgi:hypothetical protein